jgi:hypothetical protein
VARPFEAEPPKPLIGQRTREEEAEPLRITIEEFTGTKIENVKNIPVVNTLEEYRAVREAKEPAIQFDGKIYAYYKEEDVYKPLNWEFEDQNEAVWARVQYDRTMRIQQFQQQWAQRHAARYAAPGYNRGGYRSPAYTTPGGGAGTGYTRQPGVGAAVMPSSR